MFNVLLQMLDDGRVTDSQGRVVSFRNSIVILTSNIGSSFILEEESPGAARERVMQAVRFPFSCLPCWACLCVRSAGVAIIWLTVCVMPLYVNPRFARTSARSS